MKTEIKRKGKNLLALAATALLFSLILILTLKSATAIAAEVSMKIYATEDSFVSSSNPDANYNSANQIKIGSASSGDDWRAYIKFQAPDSVLAGSISKAKILLSRVGGNGATRISVYNSQDSWSEGTITWGNMPTLGASEVNYTWVNNSTGGNSTPSDSWKVFDVTLAVQEQILSDRTFSFALRSEELISNNYQIFNSDETSSYFAPVLYLEFASNGPQITGITIPESANEGSLVSIGFAASDPDGNIDSYRIYRNGIVVSNSNSYSWTPDFESAGSYVFRFEVNDTTSLSASEERTITIVNVKNLVINEFVSVPAYDWNKNTMIDASDEWIEIYNPTNSPIDITGWKLVYSFGDEDTLSGIIPANGFGTVLNPTGDLDDSGERIILKNSLGTIVDRVYYGTYGNSTSENAQSPAYGYSAGRILDGFDTEHDSTDFRLYSGAQITFNSSNNATGGSDITPPNAPVNLTANYNSGAIMLRWNAPPGESVARYNIYTSISNNLSTFNFASPTAFTSALAWTDSGASSSQKKFYAVRAADSSGNEEKNTVIVGKFDVSLLSGWNLVSFPLNITNKELGQESIVGNPINAVPGDCLSSLWRYSASGFESTDYYTGYGWYPTLSPAFTKLESGRAYWLYTNKACKITVAGRAPETITSAISTGWNLFGWYSLNEPTLGQSSLYGNPLATNPVEKLQSAWRYSTAFESTDYYTGYGWYPTLSPAFTKLESGRGYWLYSTGSCSISTVN